MHRTRAYIYTWAAHLRALRALWANAINQNTKLNLSRSRYVRGGMGVNSKDCRNRGRLESTKPVKARSIRCASELIDNITILRTPVVYQQLRDCTGSAAVMDSR